MGVRWAAAQYITMKNKQNDRERIAMKSTALGPQHNSQGDAVTKPQVGGSTRRAWEQAEWSSGQRGRRRLRRAGEGDVRRHVTLATGSRGRGGRARRGAGGYSVPPGNAEVPRRRQSRLDVRIVPNCAALISPPHRSLCELPDDGPFPTSAEAPATMDEATAPETVAVRRSSTSPARRGGLPKCTNAPGDAWSWGSGGGRQGRCTGSRKPAREAVPDAGRGRGGRPCGCLVTCESVARCSVNMDARRAEPHHSHVESCLRARPSSRQYRKLMQPATPCGPRCSNRARLRRLFATLEARGASAMRSM